MQGKVAWVTGSSRGIGLAVARRLANSGATVIIHGSTHDSPGAFGDPTTLEDLAAGIAADSGSTVGWVAGDLTDADVAARLHDEIAAAHGSPDVLVTAAGGDIGSAGVRAAHAGKVIVDLDAIGLPDAEVRTILERNFLTCVNACKVAVPSMVENRRGWVVNIGSISALTGITGSAIYAAAKAAVHEYTRCLAAQVRDHGVHANVVAPGDTMTDRFRASRELDQARVEDEGLGRYGNPDEIAAAVEFMVCPGSSYITGQVLRVDGGLQLFPA